MSNPYRQASANDMLSKLRREGFGDMIDVLADESSDGPYTKGGRVNFSKLGRLLNLNKNVLCARLMAVKEFDV